MDALVKGGQALGRRVQAGGLAVLVALAVPALSWAQSTGSIFPVSADVATVRADLILWGTAVIGVALAIYAFRRVKGMVR